MMRTKWKCKECDKLLASKQTALKHIGTYHKTADPSGSIAKVKVQVTDKEEKGSTTQNKKNPTSKNKAFGFFAPLTNIFNNESMVEGFSWGDKKKTSDQNDNTVASTSQDSVTEFDLDISNEKELDEEFSLSELIIAAADSEETTYDIMFQSSNKNPARPKFVPPVLPVCNLDKSVLDKTINDLDIQPVLESPVLSYSSPNSSEPECDLTMTIATDDPGCSAPPSQLPHHTRPDNNLSHTSFPAPVKTRGHCGQDDCVGCNTEPCGVCYRCVNERKIR